MFTKTYHTFHFCTRRTRFLLKLQVQKQQNSRFISVDLQQNCKISKRLKPVFVSAFSSSLFSYFQTRKWDLGTKRPIKYSPPQAKNRLHFYSEVKLNPRFYCKKSYIDSRENTQNFFFNRAFDKNRLKALISWSVFSFGENKTINLVEKLKSIGYSYATKAGISLSIDDLKIPPSKKAFLYEAEYGLDFSNQQVNKGHLTSIEYFSKVIETWNKTSENLKNEVIANFKKTDELNPVFLMAFSGARGNMSQVRQLTSMRGLMSDPQGKIINFPIQSNFREGLTLTEYIISCYGARKGVVDTALRTATSGYLTRRLVDVAQHVIIRGFNCGTRKGISLTDLKKGTKTLLALKNRLLGRRLAEDIYNSQNELIATRNQEINAQLSVLIAKTKTTVLVRSPITCQEKDYVCQLCYGWSLATHRLVPSGEAVGIIAGQSIGEPGTQLTMRTFHTGGVFSGDVSDELKAPVSGLVFFKTSIPGKLVRTMYGQMAFLTKQESVLFLYPEIKQKSKNKDIRLEPFFDSPQKEILKIPAYTLLFVKQNQFVEKDQIIGEAFAFLESQNQSIETYQTLYSDLSGEIRFQRIKGIRKKKNFLSSIEKGKIVETNGRKRKKVKNILNSSVSITMGEFWVLSAQKQTVLEPTNLIAKPGDFLHQNATIYCSKTYPVLSASSHFLQPSAFLKSQKQTRQADLSRSLRLFTDGGKDFSGKLKFQETKAFSLLPYKAKLTTTKVKTKFFTIQQNFEAQKAPFFYDFGHFTALTALKPSPFCNLTNGSSKKMFKKGNAFLRPTPFYNKKKTSFFHFGLASFKYKKNKDESFFQNQNTVKQRSLVATSTKMLSKTNLQTFSFFNSHFFITEVFSKKSFSLKSHFQNQNVTSKKKFNPLLFSAKNQTQETNFLQIKENNAIFSSNQKDFESLSRHSIGFLPVFKTTTGGFVAIKRNSYTTFQSTFKISSLFLLSHYNFNKKNVGEFFEQNTPPFLVETFQFDFFEPFPFFSLQQTLISQRVIIAKNLKLRFNQPLLFFYGLKTKFSTCFLPFALAQKQEKAEARKRSKFVSHLIFPLIEKTKKKLINKNSTLKFIKVKGIIQKSGMQSLPFKVGTKTKVKAKFKKRMFLLKSNFVLSGNEKAKVNPFSFENKKNYINLKKRTLNSLPKSNNLLTVYSFSIHHFIGFKKIDFSKPPFQRKVISKSLKTVFFNFIEPNFSLLPLFFLKNEIKQTLSTNVKTLKQKSVFISKENKVSSLSLHFGWKKKGLTPPMLFTNGKKFLIKQKSKKTSSNDLFVSNGNPFVFPLQNDNQSSKKILQVFNTKLFKISKSWTLEKEDALKNQVEKKTPLSFLPSLLENPQGIQNKRKNEKFNKKQKTLKQIFPLTNVVLPVLNRANCFFWFSKEQKVFNSHLCILRFLALQKRKTTSHFIKKNELSDLGLSVQNHKKCKLRNQVWFENKKAYKKSFNFFNFSNFFNRSLIFCPTHLTFLHHFAPQLKKNSTEKRKNSLFIFSLAKNKNLVRKKVKNGVLIKAQVGKKKWKWQDKNPFLTFNETRLVNSISKNFEAICLKFQLLPSQTPCFLPTGKSLASKQGFFSKSKKNRQQKLTILANKKDKVLLSLSHYQILKNYKNRTSDFVVPFTKPNLLHYSPVLTSFLNSASFLNMGLLKKNFLFKKLGLLSFHFKKDSLSPSFILFKNRCFQLSIFFSFFKGKNEKSYSNSLILVKKKQTSFLLKGLNTFQNTFFDQGLSMPEVQEPSSTVLSGVDFCLQRKTPTLFVVKKFQSCRGNPFFDISKTFTVTEEKPVMLNLGPISKRKKKTVIKKTFPVAPMLRSLVKNFVFFFKKKPIHFFAAQKKKNTFNVNHRDVQNSLLFTWLQNQKEYEKILETLKLQTKIFNSQDPFFLSEQFLSRFDKARFVPYLDDVGQLFRVSETFHYYQQLVRFPLLCLISKKITKNFLEGSLDQNFLPLVKSMGSKAEIFLPCKEKTETLQGKKETLFSFHTGFESALLEERLTNRSSKKKRNTIKTLSCCSVDASQNNLWFEKEKRFKFSKQNLNNVTILVENKRLHFFFLDFIIYVLFSNLDVTNQGIANLRCDFHFLSFLLTSPFFRDCVLLSNTQGYFYKSFSSGQNLKWDGFSANEKKETFPILPLNPLTTSSKQNRFIIKSRRVGLNSYSLLSTQRLRFFHHFQSEFFMFDHKKEQKADFVKVFTPFTESARPHFSWLRPSLAFAQKQKAKSRLEFCLVDAKFLQGPKRNKNKKKKLSLVQRNFIMRKKKFEPFSKSFFYLDKVLIIGKNIKNFKVQKKSKGSSKSNLLLTISPGWLFTTVYSNQAFTKHNQIQLPGHFIIDDIAFDNYVTLSRFLPVRFQNLFYELQTHVNFWLKTLKTFNFDKTRGFAFSPENETVFMIKAPRQKNFFLSKFNQFQRLKETNSLLNQSCFSRVLFYYQKTSAYLIKQENLVMSLFLNKSKRVTIFTHQGFSLTFEKEFLLASELDKFELLFTITKTNLLNFHVCLDQEMGLTKFIENVPNPFVKTFSLKSAVILDKKSQKFTVNGQRLFCFCKELTLNTKSSKKNYGKLETNILKNSRKTYKKWFILHPSSVLKLRLKNFFKNVSYSKFSLLMQQENTIGSPFFKVLKKSVSIKPKNLTSKSNLLEFFDKTNLSSSYSKNISLFKKVFVLKTFLLFFFNSLILFSGKIELTSLKNKSLEFSNYPVKKKLLCLKTWRFSFTPCFLPTVKSKGNRFLSKFSNSIVSGEKPFSFFKSIKMETRIGALKFKIQTYEKNAFFSSQFWAHRLLFVTLIENFDMEIRKHFLTFPFLPERPEKKLLEQAKCKEIYQNKRPIFLPESYLLIIPVNAGVEIAKMDRRSQKNFIAQKTVNSAMTFNSVLTSRKQGNPFGFYKSSSEKTPYQLRIFSDLVYDRPYQKTDTKTLAEILKTNKQIINNYCRVGNFKTLKFPCFFDEAIMNNSFLKWLPNTFKLYFVLLQNKENKESRLPLLKNLEFLFNKNTRYKPKLLLLGKTTNSVKENLKEPFIFRRNTKLFTDGKKQGDQGIHFIEKPLLQGVLSFQNFKTFSFFKTLNKTLFFVQKATQYATENAKNYKKKMYQRLDTSNSLKQNFLEKSKFMTTGSEIHAIGNPILFAKNSRLTKVFRFTNAFAHENVSSLNPSFLQKKQTPSKLLESKIQSILQLQWTFFNSPLSKKEQQKKFLFDLQENTLFSTNRYTKTEKWIRYYRTNRGHNLKIRDLQAKETSIDFFGNGKRTSYPILLKNREFVFKNFHVANKHTMENHLKIFNISKNQTTFNQPTRSSFLRKKLTNPYCNNIVLPFVSHPKAINLFQLHFHIPEPVENPLEFLFLYNVNPVKKELFQHGFRSTSKHLLKSLDFQFLFPLLPSFEPNDKTRTILKSEMKTDLPGYLNEGVKGLSSLQGEVFFATETFPLKFIELSILKKATPEIRVLTDADLLSFEILKSKTQKSTFLNDDLKQTKKAKPGNENEKLQVSVGEFVRYGKEIVSNVGLNKSGQVLLIQSNKMVLRYAKPFLLSSGGICNLVQGDFINNQAPLLTLKYKTLKTEDIVQGIPKIEQLFEARQNLENELGIPDLLKKKFLFYKNIYPKQEAVQKSIEFIQHYIIDGIQNVYQSQGVTISDKHIEIIVKQMTCKVKILDPGVSGWLRGDIVYLHVIELANLEIHQTNLVYKNVQDIRPNKKKAEYEPIVLGISKAALTIRGFISAASFQETIKILTRAAIFRRMDFLRGLKENVILGHLIPAGTGAPTFSNSEV